MSRNKKKVVRLTETEMVDLIERIVHVVKKEKKAAIQESRGRRSPSRRVVRRR